LIGGTERIRVVGRCGRRRRRAERIGGCRRRLRILGRSGCGCSRSATRTGGVGRRSCTVAKWIGRRTTGCGRPKGIGGCCTFGCWWRRCGTSGRRFGTGWRNSRGCIRACAEGIGRLEGSLRLNGRRCRGRTERIFGANTISRGRWRRRIASSALEIDCIGCGRRFLSERIGGRGGSGWRLVSEGINRRRSVSLGRFVDWA